MIVYVDDVWLVLPCCNPVEHRYLKCCEAFRIVVVTINFFAVEQAVDVKQVKIESKNIVSFLDHGEFEPAVAQVGVSLMHDIPFMVVEKLCAVHRHHDLSQMTRLVKIKWK